MHRTSSIRHASNVAPLPANGSNTSPSGGVTRRTSQRISSTGFTVGWRIPSTVGLSPGPAFGQYRNTG